MYKLAIQNRVGGASKGNIDDLHESVVLPIKHPGIVPANTSPSVVSSQDNTMALDETNTIPPPSTPAGPESVTSRSSVPDTVLMVRRLLPTITWISPLAPAAMPLLCPEE